MYNSKKNGADIAKRELLGSKLDKILFTLFLISLFASLLLLFLFFASYFRLTGFSVSLVGGNITEINLGWDNKTSYWAGDYGLVLDSRNSTGPYFGDFTPGEISRYDFLFSCIQEDAVGGNEIYASTSPTIDFGKLQPVGPKAVDDFLGCNDSESSILFAQCPSNTFTENISIMVGSRNISGIAATYTHGFSGDNKTYNLGVLNDSNNLVFVTNIPDYEKVPSNNSYINYQMMFPIPSNSLTRYYFFTDPNDNCSAEMVNVTISGFVMDNNGHPIENAFVFIGGHETYSDTTGYYHLNFEIQPGDYSFFVTREKYEPFVTKVNINSTVTDININVILYPINPNQTLAPHVEGFVYDQYKRPVPQAYVRLADSFTFTDDKGYYSFYPNVTLGSHIILSYKEDYDADFKNIYITPLTTELYYNFTLRYLKPLPMNGGKVDWISENSIYKTVMQDTFIQDNLWIYNRMVRRMNLKFEISQNLKDIVILNSTSTTISPGDFFSLLLNIYGSKPIGIYNGTLKISGDINAEIPITINIIEKKDVIEPLIIKIDLPKTSFSHGERVDYRINLQNILKDQQYPIKLKTYIKENKKNGSIIVQDKDKNIVINDTLEVIGNLTLPQDISDGNYLLETDAYYLNMVTHATKEFTVSQPLYLASVKGVPVWSIFAVMSISCIFFMNLVIYRRYKAKKTKFNESLDFSKIPKAGQGSIKVGTILDTTIPAYLELEKLNTHAIVTGATGMGKSIAAQVIVEEALAQNIAVIVIDPSAQWSSMLKKCEDKRMLNYYRQFGLRKSDAKAFDGNIRQVKNAREFVDISRHIHPGQVQIYSINKLDNNGMDIFVSNIIKQIFGSITEESQQLKVLLIFDGMHNILGKFGVKGEGILQLERASREFRKLGIGLMLVSQFYSDFPEEIKANISTHIQMRTLESSDLEGIKKNYGEDFLRHFVRVNVGTGIMQNPDYNEGKPYFVNFRPILHSTKRISDADLEKYNIYNELADDLEFQLLQLENEKVNITNLKNDFKKIRNKIRTGKFGVADIYIQGTAMKLKKEWQKLGKRPKKKELVLIKEENTSPNPPQPESKRSEKTKEEKPKTEDNSARIDEKKSEEESGNNAPVENKNNNEEKNKI